MYFVFGGASCVGPREVHGQFFVLLGLPHRCLASAIRDDGAGSFMPNVRPDRILTKRLTLILVAPLTDFSNDDMIVRCETLAVPRSGNVRIRLGC